VVGNPRFAFGISVRVGYGSRDISISGLGGHIAISCCRLLLQSLADTFFGAPIDDLTVASCVPITLRKSHKTA